MKVLVIGSTTVDVLVRDTAGLPDYGGDEFTVANLRMLQDAPAMHIGGNGGNAAAVLGALGCDVTLCTNLGADAWGVWARDQLAARGVEVVTPAGLTGSSVHVVITDAAHRRRSLYHPGVAPAADPELVAAAGVVLICGHPHPDLERVRAVARQAAGAVTLFDIGPNLGQGYTLEGLAPYLPELDWLVANEAELRDLDPGDGGADRDPLTTAASLASQTRAGVALKRGDRGAVLLPRPAGPGANTRGWSVGAFDVAVSTTIGAGDAFNAGLIYALTRNLPPPDALRTATAVAAMAVGGARGALGVEGEVALTTFLRDHGQQAPVTEHVHEGDSTKRCRPNSTT